MPLKLRFASVLAALWWGSLTGLGFLVVPLLFQHLGSPQAAGAMAAKLFAAQTWLSMGCAMLLLLLLNKVSQDAASGVAQARVLDTDADVNADVNIDVKAGLASGELATYSVLALAKSVTPWVVAGLLMAVLVEFAVSPRIVTARATGGDLKLWHALGSAMYLLQWCAAGLVLWRLTQPKP